MRIRLRRCKLGIPSKFFLPNEDIILNPKRQYEEPFRYLRNVLDQRRGCAADEHVLHTFPCKLLQIEQEIAGELIVSDTNMMFIGNDNISHANFNIQTISVSEVWLRRYQHDDIAMEFFLETNTSIFIILQSNSDREALKIYFSDKILQW